VAHRIDGRKLSRKHGPRMSLYRNLTVSVLRYERVKTTEAKAKEIRGRVERMITIAKRGDLAARRAVIAEFPNEPLVVNKLFDEIAPKYADRTSGFTRIVRLGQRRGQAGARRSRRRRRCVDGHGRRGRGRRPRGRRRRGRLGGAGDHAQQPQHVAHAAHEDRDVLAGQSWQRGQIIVAWDAVLDGAGDPHDGVNVVMHEFAHQLDQDTGAANGAPYVGRGALQQAWARVMNQEFDTLRTRLARAEPGLIEPYAATSPAEFFAVTTELFFEKPAALASERPALYEQLRRCYRLDPAAW